MYREPSPLSCCFRPRCIFLCFLENRASDTVSMLGLLFFFFTWSPSILFYFRGAAFFQLSHRPFFPLVGGFFETLFVDISFVFYCHSVCNVYLRVCPFTITVTFEAEWDDRVIHDIPKCIIRNGMIAIFFVFLLLSSLSLLVLVFFLFFNLPLRLEKQKFMVIIVRKMLI